jgi:hypothetical protein
MFGWCSLNSLHFDTNTRNHQPVCLTQSGRKSPTYFSDLERFLPDCVKQTGLLVCSGRQVCDPKAFGMGFLVSRFLLLYRTIMILKTDFRVFPKRCLSFLQMVLIFSLNDAYLFTRRYLSFSQMMLTSSSQSA